MGAPVGVPVGALRCPLCPLGSLIVPQIQRAVKGGFVPIDILRVLVVYWIVYQCFFELSTGYPQGCPQVDLGQYGV